MLVHNLPGLVFTIAWSKGRWPSSVIILICSFNSCHCKVVNAGSLHFICNFNPLAIKPAWWNRMWTCFSKDSPLWISSSLLLPFFPLVFLFLCPSVFERFGTRVCKCGCYCYFVWSGDQRVQACLYAIVFEGLHAFVRVLEKLWSPLQSKCELFSCITILGGYFTQ